MDLDLVSTLIDVWHPYPNCFNYTKVCKLGKLKKIKKVIKEFYINQKKTRQAEKRKSAFLTKNFTYIQIVK